MIELKSAKEIGLIRESGRITGQTLRLLEQAVQAGVTTLELDRLAEDYIRKNGAVPAFKGYRGFPRTVCISVNNEVVHGIPGSRKLKEGDIVSLDMGVVLKGWYSDAALTAAVGTITEDARRLMDVTKASLGCAIAKCVAGNRLHDVSHAVQSHVEGNGYAVVRDLVGHGIGRKLHEEPQVPNFGRPGHGPRLQAGMVLAIEPMVNAGTFKVILQPDEWTIVTEDGSLSAHYEHTVAITDNGPVILTLPED